MSKLPLCIRACGILVLLAGMAVSLQAQTFNTVYTFAGTDGKTPFAALILGSDGNFYGTTFSGGDYGGGTIFSIDTSGTLTTLYNFCPVKTNGICADGENPGWGSLVQGTDTNFYGTTTTGGGASNVGTVFTFNISSGLTTLYTFCANHGCPDGESPQGALVQSPNGLYFYGTTPNGGTNNGGTVFSITSTGTLTTLASLCPKKNKSGVCPHGNYVHSGLALHPKTGNFYGTTVLGGAYNYGSIFKITPSGQVTTLHSFCATAGCPDGKLAYAPLRQGNKAVLYGTTYQGGGYGFGTIFKILPGKMTTLYSFQGTDGAQPYDPPLQDALGNLYGTTFAGGAFGKGSVYELSPSGALTTLYSFCPEAGCVDGESPIGGLILGPDGNYYGTTDGGGANGFGTVFEITPAGSMVRNTSIHLQP